jgi:hypothetical protein
LTFDFDVFYKRGMIDIFFITGQPGTERRWISFDLE